MTKFLNHSNSIIHLSRQTLNLFFMVAFLSLLLANMAAASGLDTASDEKRDKSIQLGWDVFHSKCFGCHGAGAEGTIVAPNLVQSTDKLSSQQFSNKVLKGHVVILGYADVTSEDQTAVREAFIEMLKKRQSSNLIMPAWQDDPVVNQHIGALFDYLKARAEGALGPGLPDSNTE